MKTVRLLSIITAVILLLFSLSACGDDSAQGNSLPEHTEKFFVNDFANVISDSHETEIYNKGVYLNDKTTAQVVAVTVDTIGDREIYEYALELGRKWGVGTKEDDNGVIILLSVNDRNIYIAVGYGLEGAIPDSKADMIIEEYAIESFSEDDFSSGMAAMYNAVCNEVLIEYGISPEEGYVPIEEKYQSEEESGSAQVIISWIVLIIIVCLYLFIFRRRGLFFIGGPPFFGGGFSSGGFRSSGSGGFRGFSGGGGSFGGGGAGRKF